jgi:hypothetical protein
MAMAQREVTYGIAGVFFGLILVVIGCLIEHVVLVTWVGLLVLLLAVVFLFLARSRVSAVLHCLDLFIDRVRQQAQAELQQQPGGPGTGPAV